MMDSPQWRTVQIASPIQVGVPVYTITPPPSPPQGSSPILQLPYNMTQLHQTTPIQYHSDYRTSGTECTPATALLRNNDINNLKSSQKNTISWCKVCGQMHKLLEAHIYDYTNEIDEDLLCGICLQPLVSPTDTPCGHTFCQACLNSHLRANSLCPLDRSTLTCNDCQPASLMVRRLLDKLVVKCPFSTRCDTVLPRSDLENHLIKKCPGALVPCPYAREGCALVGPRRTILKHQADECTFARKPEDLPKTAVVEGEKFLVVINRSCTVLGLSIVGGSDSPLRYIVIQDVLPDSLVSKDGRLQPGDQIMEINGKDASNMTHQEACNALREMTPVLRLKIYREKVDPEFLDIFKVSMEKQTGTQLGIKLVSNRHDSGIFISEVISGSVAATEGKLQEDDRILQINGQDVRRSRLEEASLLIQTSPKKVDLIVARSKSNLSKQDSNKSDGRISPPKSKSPVLSIPISTTPPSENSPPPRPSRKPNRPITERSFQPRYIKITKAVNESLGVRIFGGLQNQVGDTPVYVTNMVPQGCVAKCKQVKKGDIMLSVNGVSLLGVSHTEAMAALKATTPNHLVTLGIVDGPETSDGSSDFVPSWMYWQQLPRSLQIPRTVVLRRSSTSNLGFSIIGGQDGSNVSQAFHILLVVPNSIAAKEGRLRCGDQILSVNGHKLEGLRHSSAVSLLKQNKNKVILEVLSWPGTAM